jgi:hypothetical protein
VANTLFGKTVSEIAPALLAHEQGATVNEPQIDPAAIALPPTLHVTVPLPVPKPLEQASGD